VTYGSWNVISKYFVPKIDGRPDVTAGWVKKLRECRCCGLEYGGSCEPVNYLIIRIFID